ncbi:hypothetical protein KY290_036089 [Solanum tuberosum]|uniref:DUF659 domain-containing protein n=1 Tax=Solanum tuberosum TaxID=4113 RepID=A0ABQ7TT30_SOLTU|nr:hypothetical protein KY290_036089 [Solanum tuberosum]
MEMALEEINIRDHGDEVLDENYKSIKARCKYCVKIVSGFHRLKLHLAGIRGNVTPCSEVPMPVKEAFNAEILAKKSFQSSQEISKSIGRFFYEAGIDFAVIRSPSFQKMVKATLSPGQTIKFPSCQELKGWILEDAVKEMWQYVTENRNSWASTGCSILLDGWIDSDGRNLINILVYSPRGTIYLRSSDISSFSENVDAMLLFYEEVGVETVVQIVAYSTSDWMIEAGQKLMDRCKTVFWSIDASHATVLKLLRDAFPEVELVKSSKIKAIVPFLTLENIVSQKNGLIRMFQSSTWQTSLLASTSVGKGMSEMIKDESFWTEALMAVKATIPLVEVIKFLNGTNKAQVGFIHDTLDQAKETIRKEFKSTRFCHAKIWNAIDDTWNKYLHSPLHDAGYYLNPTFFHSSNWCLNVKISDGLCSCITGMAEDRCIKDLITQQIGTFDFLSSKEILSDISPGHWWSKYEVEFPELERLAVRILSQTCNGASHYRLKRSLVETLHRKGRNQIEQQRLSDLVFVHCNLQLQAFDPEGENDIAEDVVDSMDEWIVGKGGNLVCENTQLTWMDLDLE